jgi:SAM-dependent methyltransferase
MHKHYDLARFRREHVREDAWILDAGSSDVRTKTARTVTVDIGAKPGVDVVGDLHHYDTLRSAMDVSGGRFDVVVCTAVLQYCWDPFGVLWSLHRATKAGGTLYLDVPWCQPYCADGPDLWRFSLENIRKLVSRAGWSIETAGPSITAGSAVAFHLEQLAGNLTGYKYVDTLLAQVAKGARLFNRLEASDRRGRRHQTSGAFYVIARA